MAFCTRCATLFADNDSHMCKPEDIPAPGKMRRLAAGESVDGENLHKTPTEESSKINAVELSK